MKPIGVICVFAMCMALGCNGKGEGKKGNLLAIPHQDGTVALFKISGSWACKPGMPCNPKTPPPPPPSPYYPCRCPHPTCYLCKQLGDLQIEALIREFGVEGVYVLPNDFIVVPPQGTSPKEGNGPGPATPP